MLFDILLYFLDFLGINIFRITIAFQDFSDTFVFSEWPSALSASVLKCLSVLSAHLPKCLSALSACMLKCLKCPSARVPFVCPSAYVPSENPSSAQRSFRLALTLTLNKKLFSEMPFKQIIKRF